MYQDMSKRYCWCGAWYYPETRAIAAHRVVFGHTPAEDHYLDVYPEQEAPTR